MAGDTKSTGDTKLTGDTKSAPDAAARVAIVVVSSAVAAGAEDRAGRRLAELCEGSGLTVVARDTVTDDFNAIARRLRAHVDAAVSVVLTVGGSGLTNDDVTPEATRAVIEREAPGIAEALRAEAIRHTPMGMLTRGVAGTAGRTLIVNLPGSPRAIEELFGALEPVLGHAVALIGSPGGSRMLHRGADGATRHEARP